MADEKAPAAEKDPRVQTEEDTTPRPKIFTSEPLRLPDGTTTTREEIEAKAKAKEEKPKPKLEEPPAAKAEEDKPKPPVEDDRFKGLRFDDLPEDLKARFARQRVNRVTAQMHDERRAREAAEARLAELEARLAAAPTAAAPQAPTRPKQEDFADYDQYVEALTDWKLEQRAPKTPEAPPPPKPAAAPPPPELPPEFFEARDAFVAEGVAKYTDFREKTAAPGVVFTQAMLNHVFEADNGVDIAYHLAENPQESARLSRLDKQALREAIVRLDTLAGVGALKTHVSSVETPEASQGGEEPAAAPPEAPPAQSSPRKRISNAPEPLKRVRGGGSEGPKPSLAELAEKDPELYRQVRMKQMRARGQL